MRQRKALATIKTVKPDGTGDFTTLQSWHDWAKTQSSPAQWAECYGGGNLGSCTFSDWTATPTASDYPRIYAAAGHGHDGRAESSIGVVAAGISTLGPTTLNRVHIDGIRATSISITNCPYTVVSNCLVVGVGEILLGITSAGLNGVSYSCSGCEVYNNIIIFTKNQGCVDLYATTPIYVQANSYTSTLGVTFNNNTILNGYLRVHENPGKCGGKCYVNTTIYNNVFAYYTTGFSGTQNGTVTGGNNFTELGITLGSNNLMGTPQDHFIDPHGNANKKYTNSLYGRGTYVSTPTTDYRGRTRHNPPDIGADEWDRSYHWHAVSGLTVKGHTELR